jgi:hypothetical protein
MGLHGFSGEVGYWDVPDTLVRLPRDGGETWVGLQGFKIPILGESWLCLAPNEGEYMVRLLGWWLAACSWPVVFDVFWNKLILRRAWLPTSGCSVAVCWFKFFLHAATLGAKVPVVVLE